MGLFTSYLWKAGRGLEFSIKIITIDYLDWGSDEDCAWPRLTCLGLLDDAHITPCFRTQTSAYPLSQSICAKMKRKQLVLIKFGRPGWYYIEGFHTFVCTRPISQAQVRRTKISPGNSYIPLDKREEESVLISILHLLSNRTWKSAMTDIIMSCFLYI